MNDFLFRTLLAVAVFFQVISGIGIVTALVLIVLGGTGVVTAPA